MYVCLCACRTSRGYRRCRTFANLPEPQGTYAGRARSPFKTYFDEQRLYRDRLVLTETGQRPETETTTKPVRKTETVECVRGVSQVKPSLRHSTVSVFRTGFVAVSVCGLCLVSVKTWRSLYSLCSSKYVLKGGPCAGRKGDPFKTYS